ncbi:MULTISPECIES: PhzF family phenazine biosynthesis protein [unclassified Streptomyces]|uniref:PhzF family phenazine biosynthesis protein n=1 Tax=unclassified Streptomyces TaxID=2593676 RepID=UPI0004C5D468|nr:PhzF family phenazine biosynthesis isomerase [Streptomyces sp. NRRL F-5630]
MTSPGSLPPAAPAASAPRVSRYAAFTTDPGAGNPAGVVLDASGLSDDEQLAVAARLGYSETAFVLPGEEPRTHRLRYFSPKAEVPFCGHATIATAVALAEREGPGAYVFLTPAGQVPVGVEEKDGELRATLTSVMPRIEDIAPGDLAEALAALGWPAADLHPEYPPRIASAGARHLVLAAGSRARLAALDYDFERLRALMERLGLTTVHLFWQDPDTGVFHTRDPFPVGGVVEDPVTGAASAAFGAYLRALGFVREDARLTLVQGEDLGRPGTVTVTLRAGDPRVRVAGTAVRIPARADD